MINQRKKVFKFKPGLDKAYWLLFGPVNPAGCSVCGHDGLDTLDIHKIEGRPGLQVLCDKCHGVTRQSIENKLQNQIGGSYV